MNIKNILNKNKEGATLDPLTLKNVNFSNGYAVSITDNAIKSIDSKVQKDLQDLINSINTIAKKINLNKYYIGYWYDKKTGVGYLDITVHISDKKTAVKMARLHNQKAIFNFKTLDSLYI